MTSKSIKNVTERNRNYSTSFVNYALERFLMETQGMDEYDAWLRVTNDYENVKREWTEYTIAEGL